MAFFSSAPKISHARVTAAIDAAEKITSGEIRVVISHRKAEDPVAAAQQEFERLGMTKTSHRNGVLFFLAPESRKFAVLGDTATHEKCGEPFWNLLAATMSAHFQKEILAGDLCTASNARELFWRHISHAGPVTATNCPTRSRKPIRP